MSYLKFIGILCFASLTILFGVALPGYTQNDIMHEQTRSYVWGGDVNVHINAPGQDSLKMEKETIICFYALPAGNTIEWTIGKEMETGDDWHYDIQHIGAQTRFVRNTLKDKNFITIYVQPTNNSWQLYDDNHPSDYVALIQSMVTSILNPFSEFDYKVTLNSHSAGGSWILRYMDGVSELPSWINRLGFIDSNYNYRINPDRYDTMFRQFLNERDSTNLCMLVYNDSTALLDGAHFIGTGGTWCTAKFMKSRLDPYFTFIDSHDVDFYRYIALDKRFELLMKKNPTHAILHTVQVYKNGFIHTMLSGTEYENVGYDYYGDPAYLEYIQGNPPARPEGVSVTPTFGGFHFQALPDEDASGYRLYFSEDGIDYVDTITVSSCDTMLSGQHTFLRVSAINQWGESDKSEWLGITPGDVPYTMLLVNALNRSYGHEYLLRHGKAALGNMIPIASCTNSMILNGLVDMNNYTMVNYIVGNEDRRNYPLNAEEIEALKAYLKQGGNLYISGSEIAYALDIKGDSTSQDFCANFLKFQCIDDEPNEQSNTYYDAAFKGFDFFDTTLVFAFDDGTQGSYNVGDPDGIIPVNGGYQSVIFTGYDPHISCAGVAFSGDFPEGTSSGKVFTMTIPFETIIGDSVRTTVMAEIVNFLLGCGAGIDPVDIPETSELLPPYPNPFNPRITVDLQLSAFSELDLSIYNLRGQKVYTMFNGKKEAGSYTFNWAAQSFSSGVYLCVMSVNGNVFDSKKIVLVK